MRTASIFTGVVLFGTLAAGAAFADQRGHATTPHGNPHASQAPTTHAAPTPGGPRTTTTPRTHGNPRTTTDTTTTTTRTHGNPHATTTTTTTTTARMNPIAAKISRHPQQAARIERMLPAGMTLNQASRGFRNQGQFIAALHVSQNLNIPFRDLRRAMTGPNAMSLGQAIHTLRPSVDANAAARRANTQAQSDVH